MLFGVTTALYCDKFKDSCGHVPSSQYFQATPWIIILSRPSIASEMIFMTKNIGFIAFWKGCYLNKHCHHQFYFLDSLSINTNFPNSISREMAKKYKLWVFKFSFDGPKNITSERLRYLLVRWLEPMIYREAFSVLQWRWVADPLVVLIFLRLNNRKL